MNAGDFREYVVHPTLVSIGMHSDVAEELVMGTAAQESGFAHLEQIRGPARGFFQMEPFTYRSLWDNYISARPAIVAKARMWAAGPETGPYPDPDQMTWNLRYACAMCRIHYFAKSAPLPTSTDPVQLAAYWKRWYNTALGKGTEAEFIANYARLVAGGKSAID